MGLSGTMHCKPNNQSARDHVKTSFAHAQLCPVVHGNGRFYCVSSDSTQSSPIDHSRKIAFELTLIYDDCVSLSKVSF